MLRQMLKPTLALVLGASLAPAGTLLAQDAAAPQVPATSVQPAEDELRSEHGDWDVRCATGAPQDVCYLSQVLNNDEGEPLLRAVVRKVDNPQVEAIMTVQAPLGVVLPRGLSMSIDSAEAQQAPFLYCVQNGCYAQIAVAEEGLQRLRRGATANLEVFSVQQPENAVDASLSLIGFTAGYDALPE